MRRRRYVDLTQDGNGGYAVEAFLRDSYSSGSQEQSVVHEYDVSLTLDSRLLVTGGTVGPRVLPSGDCVPATASISHIIGIAAGDLRSAVSDLIVGVGGCTHLTDTLRTVADADAMVSVLQAAECARGARPRPR